MRAFIANRTAAISGETVAQDMLQAGSRSDSPGVAGGERSARPPRPPGCLLPHSHYVMWLSERRPRRAAMSDHLERTLLWLWKVLPLPMRARRAYLELTHPRFLIGVMALIQDEQGRVLILEHTYRRAYPWGLPGGYLQAREEPARGLAREVAEETGLRVEVGPPLAVGMFVDYQLDILFPATVLGGQPRPTAEVAAWRFVPVAELDQILPNQLAMLRRAGIGR